MRIFLLPVKGGGYRLYIHSPEIVALREAVGSHAPAGEMEKRKANIFKRTLQAVSKREKEQERRLKELRKLTHITVYYPRGLSASEAREIYEKLFRAEIKRHKRRLIVNGLLLPLSIVFTLFPGPNVVFAYLAWRTLSHYRSKKGGEKGLKDIEVTFAADPLLEELQELLNKKWVLKRKERIHRLGKRLGIEHLEKMY